MKVSLAAKISFSVGLVLGIGIFLSVTLFRGTKSDYVAEVPQEPTEESIVENSVSSPVVEEVSVSAAGAYSMGGEELYSFRSDKRWPIASITKLMTAVTADRLYLSKKPYEYITITDDMVATEGTSGELHSGQIIRADDLIKAMMLVSSNDAASALAMHYGQDRFVSEMNKIAAELGMTDTTFTDPTGLSVQDLSTVEDLRRLAKFIWENDPYIFEITQNKSGTIYDAASGSSWTLSSINEFSGRSDFLGGKTGTTPEAEGNLISIFALPNNSGEVIIIVLGTEDRFVETEKILEGL